MVTKSRNPEHRVSRTSRHCCIRRNEFNWVKFFSKKFRIQTNVNGMLLIRSREPLFSAHYRAPLAATCHIGAPPNVLRADLIAAACRRLTRKPLSVSKQHSSPDRNINPIRYLFQATLATRPWKSIQVGCSIPFPTSTSYRVIILSD